jgi:hypothetical protein
MAKSDLEVKIQKVLSANELDLRKTKYRFMDQKVTPDVLNFVSDCIENLDEKVKKRFTKNDVWNSNYFEENIKVIYNKPNADNETMIHEYDKFCAQPLKSLSYAGVLKEEKSGNTNYYTIVEEEILSLLTLNERNCWLFIRTYVTEVLKRSNFYSNIEKYNDRMKKDVTDNNAFEDLKKSFIDFILANSQINGEVEIRRIFPKVINPIVVDLEIPGSVKGRISKGPYKYADLMYNGVNFRDADKNKQQSRQEAGLEKPKWHDSGYALYKERKVMQKIRARHTPISEVKDEFKDDEATQVHHIFPKSRFPEFRAYAENLILLTAQQHYTKAHPNNKTHLIDKGYQLVCLENKLESIRISDEQGDAFYSKITFIYLLNSCFDLNLNPDMSYANIKDEIIKLKSNLY